MEIRLEQVAISLQKQQILSNINIKIENRQLTFLLGLNGSGKTTLIKAVMGLLPIDSGSIYYDNKNIKDISTKERAKQIAYIPQKSELWLHEKVEDFILTGSTPFLSTFETPKDSWRQPVKEAMEEFKIDHLKNSYIDAISGGEQKLVYLARARVQNTGWMVLDEPTAALDYSRQYEFMYRLRNYSKKEKKGVLLSVHDPNLALKYADSVVVLDQKTVKACISRQEHEFENKLVETLNQVYGDKLKLINSNGTYSLDWRDE